MKNNGKILKEKFKSDVDALITHVSTCLRQLEEDVAKSIDERVCILLANIFEKESYWLHRARVNEISKVYDNVRKVLTETNVDYQEVTEIKLQVEAIHETIGKTEANEQLGLQFDISNASMDFDHILQSLSAKDLLQQLPIIEEGQFGKRKLYAVDDCIKSLIADGDLQAFKTYLDKFPDKIRRYLLRKEYDHQSILFEAIRNCNMPFLRYLVEDCRIPISEVLLSSLSTNTSPLHSIEETAEYLVSQAPSQGGNLLHLAIDLDNVKLCQVALDQYQVDIEMPSSYNEKALISAIRKNHWNVFSFLLQRGAKQYCLSHEEGTAIHETLQNKRNRNFILECLYRNHNSLYQKNFADKTAVEELLQLRPCYSEEEITEWEDLLDILMPKVPNVLHVLRNSTTKGQITQRRQWQRDKNYITYLLLKAVEARDKSILDCLKQVKCLDWKVQEPYNGMTLLHKAAKLGNLHAVNFLAKHIDINCRTYEGQTPLHFASFWGHFRTVASLRVRHGANVNLLDNSGLTALDYCEQGIRQGNKDAGDVKKLLNRNDMVKLKRRYCDCSSSEEDEFVKFGQYQDGNGSEINENINYLPSDSGSDDDLN